MRIRAAEILTVRLPLRFTFRHALATRDASEVVVLRLETDAGHVGYGECVPRAYVTGESAASVCARLQHEAWLPRAMMASFDCFEEVVALLSRFGLGLGRDRHAAACALELALLDAAGREFGRSVGEQIGPIVNPEVRYSAIVSAEDPERVGEICRMAADRGFRSLKLKLGADDALDRSLVSAAFEASAGRCTVRADANCAWRPEAAVAHLESLAALGLSGIEQPVAAEDRAGMKWITARSPVPVIADESLVSMEDARWLAGERGCNVFNLRLSKCAGILNALRMKRLADEAGIACMVGAQVGESVLLTAAGRHVATRCSGLVFFEGSYGTLLLEQDIGVEDLTILSDGRAGPIEGMGLGVNIDPLKLAAVTTQRVRLESGA